jgi:hypothetical protein
MGATMRLFLSLYWPMCMVISEGGGDYKLINPPML